MKFRIHLPCLKTAYVSTEGWRVAHYGTSPEMQRLVGLSVPALERYAAERGWRVERDPEGEHDRP